MRSAAVIDPRGHRRKLDSSAECPDIHVMRPEIYGGPQGGTRASLYVSTVERWWCNRGCVPDSTGWLTSPGSAGDLQRSSIASRRMSRSPRASHSWWPAMRRARNSDSGSPSSCGRVLSRWSVRKAPGRREWFWPGFWLVCGGDGGDGSSQPSGPTDAVGTARGTRRG